MPKKKTTELAKTQTAVADTNQAEVLIAQAIQQGTPVETIERLLAMRRELKAERAKEIYDEAMAGFQSECPIIKKTKSVQIKTGVVAYRYAPIESIVSQVKSLLKKYGFSYSTKIKTEKGLVKATCIVKQLAGHSEEYEMEVPLGTKTAVMSDSQVVAAAATFAKRYAFCNAFGILTGDEDNDAVNTGNKNLTPPKETPAQMFEKAKKMIAGSSDSDGLIDLDGKIKNSKTYNAKQKEVLHNLINARVDKLNET